jgi:hypothetical protein
LFYTNLLSPGGGGATLPAVGGRVPGVGARGYHFLDCQQATPHVLRLGAREIPRTEFLRRLNLALREPTEQGSWSGCGLSGAWSNGQDGAQAAQA